MLKNQGEVIVKGTHFEKVGWYPSIASLFINCTVSNGHKTYSWKTSGQGTALSMWRSLIFISLLGLFGVDSSRHFLLVCKAKDSQFHIGVSYPFPLPVTGPTLVWCSLCGYVRSLGEGTIKFSEVLKNHWGSFSMSKKPLVELWFLSRFHVPLCFCVEFFCSHPLDLILLDWSPFLRLFGLFMLFIFFAFCVILCIELFHFFPQGKLAHAM